MVEVPKPRREGNFRFIVEFQSFWPEMYIYDLEGNAIHYDYGEERVEKDFIENRTWGEVMGLRLIKKLFREYTLKT